MDATDASLVERKDLPAAPERARVRIGAVSYLNTLPLIEGLRKAADIDLTLAAPSLLGGMLERGEVDVALAPVIDAQRIEPAPVLLPCGVIGSDGPTMTVRLFSRRPLDEIDTVHADAESHTSVTLLKILLRERLGRDAAIVEFDAREGVAMNRPADEWPETVLLIGDKVVTSSPQAVRYPHSLDLGEAWRAMTGLPFVYAAWMCLPERADSPEVALASALLDRQRRHNRMRLDWIVTARAGERRWPGDLAREYLGGCLHYAVGDAERAAVDRFFDLALEVGALAERRPTRWRED